MKGYIANTDFGWYSFLRDHPELEEVNFWKPLGGSGFKALQPGQPFFFKLKKAYGNAIVGFGFFILFKELTVQESWSAFGTGNGASNLDLMWQRVSKYLRKAKSLTPSRSHTVGCILLTSPVIFPKDLWVQGPADWHDNIVAGKGYDTSIGEGRRIWNECLERSSWLQLNDVAETNLNVVRESRFGEERLIRPRLGQGSFRYSVEQAYQQCAVTREHSLPALDAAHIVSYSEGGTHEVSNGLLLRADVHRLFDRGYVSVSPDYEFKVSERLREDFQNGKVYYQLKDNKIWLPKDHENWPKKENLEYHLKSVFLE